MSLWVESANSAMFAMGEKRTFGGVGLGGQGACTAPAEAAWRPLLPDRIDHIISKAASTPR
jgi:hypothetical protein